MKIYKKQGDTIQIICSPEESMEKGDYLLIEDRKVNRGLIVQVVDIQFANLPGILEDILRDVITEGTVQGCDYDPFNISSQIAVLKDTKLLVCKIRGAIEDGKPKPDVSWLPSRTNSRIIPFPIERLTSSDVRKPVTIGKTKTNPLTVDVRMLDGRLNIITGRKGTGKSHLSKLLLLALIHNGAPCLVFDVNGEYVNIGVGKCNKPIDLAEKIKILVPGRNLKFTLDGVGLRSFLDTMIYALDLPRTSSKVFSRIWSELERCGNLNLNSLAETIRRFNCHESVREAINSRYHTILDLDLFTDDPASAFDFNYFQRKLNEGSAFIVNMRDQHSLSRRFIVELFLSKLTEQLSEMRLKAIFLFAEEAHFYLRETYWDDIVTRMRHLGIFTTFITNQPDTVQESVYRQADNIFMFNFTNENDLDAVSKVSKIDAESLRLIVKDLPAHNCLIVGDIVRDFPVVVNVKPLDVQTMGQTRKFFQD
ncbi:ATP-binding protein [Candidatus Bathyarchaeota archaeon]|nr:ATP-binding protein [Candidatus Bathyarchaeota archaeon]MBS7629744.1 ATP-binding protein [Candidatus Bathyarchaeota archaeon]